MLRNPDGNWMLAPSYDHGSSLAFNLLCRLSQTGAHGARYAVQTAVNGGLERLICVLRAAHGHDWSLLFVAGSRGSLCRNRRSRPDRHTRLTQPRQYPRYFELQPLHGNIDKDRSPYYVISWGTFIWLRCRRMRYCETFLPIRISALS
jgi:hypothetical protein